MMGAAQFALMRPDAWFITTARGFIHDEHALAEALAGRRSPAPAWMCGRTSRRRTTILC